MYIFVLYGERSFFIQCFVLYKVALYTNAHTNTQTQIHFFSCTNNRLVNVKTKEEKTIDTQ